MKQYGSHREEGNAVRWVKESSRTWCRLIRLWDDVFMWDTKDASEDEADFVFREGFWRRVVYYWGEGLPLR